VGKWWEGLRAGRSFVTNGPMLLVTANGSLPGQVLTAGPGEAVQVALKGELTARDRVRLCHAVWGMRFTPALREITILSHVCHSFSRNVNITIGPSSPPAARYSRRAAAFSGSVPSHASAQPSSFPLCNRASSSARPMPRLR